MDSYMLGNKDRIDGAGFHPFANSGNPLRYFSGYAANMINDLLGRLKPRWRFSLSPIELSELPTSKPVPRTPRTETPKTK